jgi:hypothetical protein
MIPIETSVSELVLISEYCGVLYQIRGLVAVSPQEWSQALVFRRVSLAGRIRRRKQAGQLVHQSPWV